MTSLSKLAMTLLTLTGCGFGQTIPNSCWPIQGRPSMRICASHGEFYLDQPIIAESPAKNPYFLQSRMWPSPEPCGPQTNIVIQDPSVPPNHYIPHCEYLAPDGKVQKGCEMPPSLRIPDCEHISGCVINDGYLAELAKKPIPLDVAAIQVSRPEPDVCKDGALDKLSSGKQWCKDNRLKWTCADKTRILEHDEQDPPKYWCRKVQP